MSKKVFIIMLLISINSFPQLFLSLDSITIVNSKSMDSSELNLKINWRICNKTNKKIKNINRLWYLYPEFVVMDSIKKIGDSITINEGIGNTLVYLRKDSKIIQPATVDGYLQHPGTDISRFNLKKGRCKTGYIYVFFRYIKRKSLYSLRIKYDTRFQRIDGQPIWRGRMETEDYEIKTP